MEEISFARLKGMLADKGKSMKSLSEETGIGYSTVQQLVAGNRGTGTDTVAKVCAALRCSARDVMEFRGIDVADRYMRSWREYYPPVYGGVSYEPLRQLFRATYKEGWRKRLAGLYEKAGIPVAVRTKINSDEGVSVRFVYEICRVLRCTPDYVMEYK